MRALVVDDSRGSRRIVSRILGNLGFEVLEAGNGREALACLNDMSQTAHLVMLAWNMRLMDGIDFLRAVRAERIHAESKRDLVTVDIEMPEIDGLQTLAAIRQSYPRLPVIVFSSLAERGAAATIDALLLAANGYVMKPTDVASLASGVDRFHQKLISKTKVYCSTPGGIRGAACPSRLSKRLS